MQEGFRWVEHLREILKEQGVQLQVSGLREYEDYEF